MLNKECDWNFILIRMFVSIEVFLGCSWNLFNQEFKLLIFWIYVPYIMQYHRHFFRILSYFNLVQYWQVLFFACFLYLVSYFTHFQLILIIIWEKINLITVRDPVVLWFSVLYREIHWHFMYISFSISNLILSDFTDSLTQHKIFCILSRQYESMRNIWTREGYLPGLTQDFCFRRFLYRLPVFSVDYSFWSWHLSTAQRFPLRYAKYSIYLSETYLATRGITEPFLEVHETLIFCRLSAGTNRHMR